jgi:hypothetical protein
MTNQTTKRYEKISGECAEEIMRVTKSLEKLLTKIQNLTTLQSDVREIYEMHSTMPEHLNKADADIESFLEIDMTFLKKRIDNIVIELDDFLTALNIIQVEL